MNVREGLIPTILGTAVSATGFVLRNRMNNPQMASSIIFSWGSPNGQR